MGLSQNMSFELFQCLGKLGAQLHMATAHVGHARLAGRAGRTPRGNRARIGRCARAPPRGVGMRFQVGAAALGVRGPAWHALIYNTSGRCEQDIVEQACVQACAARVA